ncbi:MAG: hypothetical protein RQ752_13480, partial [Thermohalobaculum sp.]|nr:hypothetical protein [Thermohalobaculum sp.]
MGPGMMGGGMGYGMGPGMMGPGMGYGMGPGMMGGGMGYGMGPGMMGPGMGYGMGPGMMGPGMGYGMGQGAAEPLDRDLSAEAAQHVLEHRLAWGGNPNLKLGKVEVRDDDTIDAEIVTKDGSLVERLEIDRHTGRMQPVR